MRDYNQFRVIRGENKYLVSTAHFQSGKMGGSKHRFAKWMHNVSFFCFSTIKKMLLFEVTVLPRGMTKGWTLVLVRCIS